MAVKKFENLLVWQKISGFCSPHLF